MTRITQAPLNKDENTTLHRIATLRELWRETGPWDYRVNQADMTIAGCNIMMALGEPMIKVEGHNVTDIAGPWFAKIREQLDTELADAEAFHAAKGEREAAETARKDRIAAGEKRQTKDKALAAYKG